MLTAQDVGIILSALVILGGVFAFTYRNLNLKADKKEVEGHMTKAVESIKEHIDLRLENVELKVESVRKNMDLKIEKIGEEIDDVKDIIKGNR